MDTLIRKGVVVLRGMWQQRWIGVVVAWAIGLPGAVGLWLVPDQFEGSARIFVDTQSILKPLMSGLTVQANTEQQLAMLSRTLISRPNVEKLIGMADLDHERKSAESLVESVMRRLEFQSVGHNNLYLLKFRDTDPIRAKKVVEALASIFMESSRGASFKDSVSAKKFIDEQIQSYELKLSEAENRLKEFKVRHIGLSEGGKDYFSRIDELSANLNEARLGLREAENSRDALRRGISGEDPLVLNTNPIVTKTIVQDELDVRIESLRRNLDGLLQKYTDQHPDVVGTRRVLVQLEEQRRQEHAARDRTGMSKEPLTGTANVVYQELKISLAKAEASVASLRARVAEYEGRLKQLRDSARLMPQVEAELAQLNRDYEVNKKNYEALVARRESAEISGDMEKATGVADFRLVDPPQVSPKPVSPKRLLLLPLILVAALFAGAGASFAATRIWPTFFDVSSLREVCGVPVLGSVTFHENEMNKRSARYRTIGFLSAVGALIGGYFAAILLVFILSSRAG